MSEVTDLLELEFQVSVSHLVPVLGIELRSSRRANMYSALSRLVRPLTAAFVERPLKLL